MEDALPKTRVLVVSERPDILPELLEEMEKHPYLEVVGDVVHPENALDSRLVPPSVSPDVILIAGDEVPKGLFELVEKLLTRWPHTLVVSLAPPLDTDRIQQMLLNGVRAVLPLGWSNGKVAEALRRLHLQEWYRLQGSAGKEAGGKSKGYVISLVGTKGGIGRTFLAVNLSVALQRICGKPVILMDADWGDVDVSLYMNLVSRYSVADLLSHHEEMDDSLLSGVLTPHSSGVEVLTAPKKPFSLPPIPPDFFSKLFSLLQSRFAYVVVDTGPQLDEVTTQVMEHSDLALLITTPDIASMQQASLLLETLHAWKYPEEKIRLLINRAGYSGGVPEKEMESFFGTKPLAILPDEVSDAMTSANKGIPLLQSDSGSLAKEIKKLAKKLSSEDAASTDGGSPSFRTKKVLPLDRRDRQGMGQLFWFLTHAWGR